MYPVTRCPCSVLFGLLLLLIKIVCWICLFCFIDQTVSIQTVIIEIGDENDNKPVFREQIFTGGKEI